MKKVRLFCLPYAGGSAMVYNQWLKYLDQSIDLFPVELAGRGTRFSTPFYANFNDAVTDIFNIVYEHLGDLPYAFFGHSMGCYLVYELCWRIKNLELAAPVHLFFSGSHPPHIKQDAKTIHDLPPGEFREKIIEVGGTPREVFDDPELAGVFLPILRADYKILEMYQADIQADQKPLGCGISVFHGKTDPSVDMNDIMQWDNFTSDHYQYFFFEGGHFFISDNAGEVTREINNLLRKINTF